MSKRKAKVVFKFEEKGDNLIADGKVHGNALIATNGMLIAAISDLVENGIELKEILTSVKKNYKVIKEQIECDYDEEESEK